MDPTAPSRGYWQAAPTQVTAVLVSYNTAELTCRAVKALRESPSGDALEIIVVDNDSRDGTASALRSQDPNVVIIENADNRGFGAANNQGMKAARAGSDYFLLINTDAFAEPDVLNTLVRRMEAAQGLGVLGPKLLNQDGSIQVSCYGFPTPARAWIENLGLNGLTAAGRFGHETAAEPDFVSGACFLVRREVFEKTGGFDESFFMYAEETDWQRRIRDAGWRVGFEPAAAVTHLGGGSQTAGRINPEFFRSMDHYVRKHHGHFGLFLFHLAMLLGVLLRLPIRALLATRNKRQAAKLRVNLFVLKRILLGETAAQPQGEAPT